MLELYQYEECPFCRVVREKLTELALDYICRNAPPGCPEKDRPLIALSGGTKVPFLVDADAGIYLFGPHKIIAYLEEKYGGKEEGVQAFRRSGVQANSAEDLNA